MSESNPIDDGALAEGATFQRATIDMNHARFELGQVVATPGARAELVELGTLPEILLRRHIAGD